MPLCRCGAFSRLSLQRDVILPEGRWRAGGGDRKVYALLAGAGKVRPVDNDVSVTSRAGNESSKWQ